MPVLSEKDVLEGRRDAMNHVDDLIAVGNGKRAAGTEIILDVDDDQHIRRSYVHHPGNSIPSWQALLHHGKILIGQLLRGRHLVIKRTAHLMQF